MNKEHSVDAYLRLAAKVFENSHEGIIVTNFRGEIELVNPAFTKITGYTLEEVLGYNPRMFKSGLHDEIFYYNLWNDLKNKGEWSGELWNKRKDGSLYAQWMTLSSLRDDEGQVTGYASIFTDITEKKRVEEKLHEDLALAKRVQKSVLSQPIMNEKLKVNGVNIASDELAGDMYAWYQINDDEYGIILIDVMGHGVASSLVCMSVRSLLRRLITKLTDPVLVAEELNEYMKNLFSENNGRMPYFFSMIYIVVNTRTKEIKYVNAGHPPGIVLVDGEPHQLEASIPSLGFLPVIDVKPSIISYTNSVQMLLYTDGLIEKADMGITESIKEVEKLFIDLCSLDNEKLIKYLIERSINCDQLLDDVSVVSIKIT